jgi:transaldolase
MKIWLDTANISKIREAVDLGILFGVTTNPTIVAKAGKPIEELLELLLQIQKGPVTAQVIADDADGMVRQGQQLHSLSKRIIIKIPVTYSGYKAIHLLSKQKIPTMATVVFAPLQALLSASAGADYVAPYLGRMEKNGIDPWEALASMKQIFSQSSFKTKILAASLNRTDQILRCAEMGIDAVTLKEEIFSQLMQDYPLTLQGVEQFQADYNECIKVSSR